MNAYDLGYWLGASKAAEADLPPVTFEEEADILKAIEQMNQQRQQAFEQSVPKSMPVPMPVASAHLSYKLVQALMAMRQHRERLAKRQAK